MYDRILVPLDGSPIAEQILPYAAKISRATGTPLFLLRAFHPIAPEMIDGGYGLYVDRLAAGYHDEALDYLNGVKVRLENDGISITCDAREGDAATVIIREAESTPDTLIAMSTHGRSGISRWVMGSVTEKVVHSIDNPFLVVRSEAGKDPTADVNLETIIVPVDGSEIAEQVLPRALHLAKALSLKIVLLQVTPSVGTLSSATEYQRLDGSLGLHFGTPEEMVSKAEQVAEEYLTSLAGRLREQGAGLIEHRIAGGHGADVIIDLAQETPNNLVAMTTHGRSGPARWALGSVTDRVVRHCGDPVLVVRAR